MVTSLYQYRYLLHLYAFEIYKKVSSRAQIVDEVVSELHWLGSERDSAFR